MIIIKIIKTFNKNNHGFIDLSVCVCEGGALQQYEESVCPMLSELERANVV